VVDQGLVVGQAGRIEFMKECMGSRPGALGCPSLPLAFRRFDGKVGNRVGFDSTTTLTIKSNEARARAEASFRKEERAKEGKEAIME
jgi:hypothetical protein